MKRWLSDWPHASPTPQRSHLLYDLWMWSKISEYAMHNAFAIGFNKRRSEPAELITHHIDKIVCKDQGSTSKEAFNEHLDTSLASYHFTADKDVFHAFCHRALMKWLLLGRSASDDGEKTMLKK